MNVGTCSQSLSEASLHLTPGHAQIERLVGEILSIPRSHTAEQRALWLPLAAILVAHLDEEERHLIPVLLGLDARAAKGLVFEHRHLRSRVAELDAKFVRGALDASALRGFAEEVLAHHRHELAVLERHAIA